MRPTVRALERNRQATELSATPAIAQRSPVIFVLGLRAGCCCHVLNAVPTPNSLRATLAALLVVTTACAETTPRPKPLPGSPQHGAAWLYLPGSTEAQLVRYTVENGEAVMGGDIRLGPVDALEQNYGAPEPRLSGAHGLVSINGSSRLWPDGVIPYEIDGSVGGKLRGEIAAAVAELDERTRLTIRPRTPLDQDFIVFNTQNSAGTCDSLLGRSGGGQPVRVNGCSKPAIMHEILHAAGFDHEHQRADRDTYVTILWDNVQPSPRDWLERIDRNRTVHTPYDHHSIMHYQSTAFSRNGRPTIVSRVPGVDVRGVQTLSSLDVQAVDRVYAGGGGGSDGSPPIFGGLPLPIPGWGQASLPFPGAGASLPGLPQLGTISDAASSLPIPWLQ